MADAATDDPVVSSETDLLVLVDEADNALGVLDKAACHDGDGRLHRAFSVFVLDRNGRVLLQQRAHGKRLWPGYWSNSCCSHPRAGEALETAAVRRLEQELGLVCTLERVYAFTYRARYGERGTEHEYCHVFLGRSDATPQVNRHEVAAWRWVAPEELERELEETPERFTPWFRLEWAELRSAHGDRLGPRA
jgi:isopentenyl-diphosphate delta-isomerase